MQGTAPERTDEPAPASDEHFRALMGLGRRERLTTQCLPSAVQVLFQQPPTDHFGNQLELTPSIVADAAVALADAIIRRLEE